MQTATFTFADTAALRDHFEGRVEREEYGRYGNPTTAGVEAKLAALEGTEAALLFASGMAAITTVFFSNRDGGSMITRHSGRPCTLLPICTVSAPGSAWICAMYCWNCA